MGSGGNRRNFTYTLGVVGLSELTLIKLHVAQKLASESHMNRNKPRQTESKVTGVAQRAILFDILSTRETIQIRLVSKFTYITSPNSYLREIQRHVVWPSVIRSPSSFAKVVYGKDHKYLGGQGLVNIPNLASEPMVTCWFGYRRALYLMPQTLFLQVLH